MKKNKSNILICVWNSIGIVIVAGFLLYGLIVGGSASLGYCENNTYFLGNHGEYTQVSKCIYQISYVWEFLFWIFLPLTPLGCFMISRIQEKTEQKRTRLE